jgi:DNA-binding transcriptional regulator YiaG
MKSALGKYDRKKSLKGLDELDKWLSGKSSAFRKVPVEAVSKAQVKEARQAVHLTQEKFAQVLGVNPVTVRFWESGRRNPDGLARKILRLLVKRPDLAKELARV